MSTVFRKYQSSDFEDFCQLVLAQYSKDGTKKSTMNTERVALTAEKLSNESSTGQIFIFEKNGETVGYSIINRFWSNEFSGEILYVDELHIRQQYRSLGIGGEFLTFLETNGGKDSVAFMLETTKDNSRAIDFYQKNGFVGHHNYLMFKEFVK